MNEATLRQNAASSPGRSSWVAANAGSGKTRVLTDRVARLLLAGTEPARILCLTYTKAAAAEMQTRLFRTLGAWAMLDDGPLRAALVDLGEVAGVLGAVRLGQARTLFARALETPGGLKIQTIHAFCEALLRRFPLEAGVAPGFAVLEDRAAQALRREVLDALAEAEPGLVTALAGQMSGDDPDGVLREIGQNRAAFAGVFDAEAVAAVLGILPGAGVAALAAEVLAAGDLGVIGEIATLCETSGPRDRGVAVTLRAALAANDPDTRLAGLEAALLTGKGAAAPFTAKTKFPVKALRAAHPALMARLDDLAGRVEDARPRRLGIAAFARTQVLHRFARAWLAALDARKAQAGLLDFDDMIDRARLLLGDPATAAWVLWKLDGGLDHILVDEAQDTSPAQWEIVRALSEEFFAGAGGRDVERTVFVVGDEKQSIYSFQGADPAAFGAMRRHFEARLDGMGQALQLSALVHSFRSAGPILALVDQVFHDAAGMGLDADVTHAPFDPARPGRVELWPFLPKPEKEEQGPWYQPLDAPQPDDPVEVLAARIALRIRGWLDAGTALRGSAPLRPVRAGDVMILVQRRGPLFHAVVRALKRSDVPVAGADVLRIGGELAVRDLLAALRVAATPGDDLSLAAMLRSPLGGLDEVALFELAHGRTGTLLGALRAAPPDQHVAVRVLIEDLMAQADFLRPHEMLQRVLIRHGGRAALVARLGAEAEEGIDALLDQALAYERAEAPSLTGFLGWMDEGELTIKRRVEKGADQVRVMTVHGAKGLEAPIVILPDTAPRQEGRNAPCVLRPEGGPALWRMAADAAPPTVADAEAARRARAREENMRLLDGALTRAESWLIVAGAGGAPKPGDDSWHELVRIAMEEMGAEEEWDGTLTLDAGWEEVVAEAPVAASDAAEWAPAPARVLARAVTTAPSALGGVHVLAGTEPDEEARARGDAIHLLLERLQGVPIAARAEVAAGLLPGWPALDDLLVEAAGVLDAPELGAVFAAGTLAEVDVTAPLPGDLRILGRIDRLVIGADEVLAVDFKSNRAVPDQAEDVPEGILRQMGAYRAALAGIWPGRRVGTAIVWTRPARLMRLPDTLVDGAFARAAGLDPGGAGS